MTGTGVATGLAGRCQCGAVRLHAGPPVTAYCCHCTECRRQAASAHGISVMVAREGLVVEGETAAWTRDRGEPYEVAGHFCPRCGVRLFHAREGSGRATIKGGVLDAIAELPPVGHIWIASALPWVRPHLDGLLYERQPPNYDALLAAWRERAGMPA